MSIAVLERVRSWLAELCSKPPLVDIIKANLQWRAERARRNHKCLWRCYRDGGGGQLITPTPMTETRAVAWVSRVANAEVFHVDFEHRMIFYRSIAGNRGG